MTINTLALTAALACTIAITGTAQAIKPYRALSGAVLYATHGSGDMIGAAVEFGYEFELHKRLTLYNNLGFTLHGSYAPHFGSRSTAPYFNTTGVQSTPTLLFAVVNAKRQKLKLGGGGLVRMQMNGNPNGFGISVDPQTGENTYRFSDVEGMTLNLGYRFGFEYVFAVFPKLDISARSFFQNDTNGDALLISGFQLSRKF